MRTPNPGYPPPEDVYLVTKGGFRIAVKVEFFDLSFDGGVPTPRFLLSIDGAPDQIANIDVDHLDVGVYPPGTIIMFPQVGNALDNADKIITRSRRAASIRRGIGFDRDTDPHGGRITPP